MWLFLILIMLIGGKYKNKHLILNQRMYDLVCGLTVRHCSHDSGDTSLHKNTNAITTTIEQYIANHPHCNVNQGAVGISSSTNDTVCQSYYNLQ